MTRAAVEYIEKNRERFKKELFDLLRIPSVSSDPQKKGDVDRCAKVVLERLKAAGLRADLFPTAGHPIVYGERVHGGRPTVLIYRHYDVQPPAPLHLWRHGAFEPTMEGDSVIARGACDDKGQFMALLAGVEAALQTGGGRGVDLKVLIEGEEEVGSGHLAPFIKKERERLRAEYVVIADTSQFRKGVPAITYGLKGLVYLELIVRGPKKDLHSGSYGGAVMNPANALTRMIAACQGPFGKAAIPGFYDSVRPLEPWEREEFARLPFDEKEFQDEVGSPRLVGEEGFTTLERKWARPTFDVNGLVSGHTGEGSKTVLPSEARAKFSMRLVPDQKPEEIERLVRAYLKEITPPGVTIEILSHHGASPVLVSREGPAVRAAERAMEVGFGKRPVFMREGGSIPIVTTFKQQLGVDTLLLGWGLDDDNTHSPNEKFSLADFHRGIKASAHLWGELGSLANK